MIYREEEAKKPEILGARTVGIALAVHVAFFLLIYLLALFGIRKQDVVIPIDLTVVVNENLDGKEDEPPPLEQSKPEPPKPPVMAF